jgi:hypothetical protein
LLHVVKLACRMADALDHSAVRYRPVPYSELLQSAAPGVRRALFPTEEDLRANLKARLAVFQA